VSQTTTEAPTKERIVEAAVDLFHRQGYNATSLRQIADDVGLQVGSLYNHMSSKEQLLFDIMRDVMEELIEHTEEEMASVGSDSLDRVLAFLRASIHFHATRQKQTFIGNSELRGLSPEHRAEIVELRDRYETMLRDTLQAAQDDGAIEVSDVQLATFAALALCTSVATWYRPNGRLSLEDLDRLLPQFFGPLCSARARWLTPPRGDAEPGAAMARLAPPGDSQSSERTLVCRQLGIPSA
jgi:TetR/AcrR family transcriptional regulator, cholesterol catabolism regulator